MFPFWNLLYYLWLKFWTEDTEVIYYFEKFLFDVQLDVEWVIEMSKIRYI